LNTGASSFRRANANDARHDALPGSVEDAIVLIKDRADGGDQRKLFVS